MDRRAPFVSCLLLAACATAGPSAEEKAMATAPSPQTAPTPFTADQIREGCPKGTWWIFRQTGPDGSVTYDRTEFATADAKGATFAGTPVDPEGKPAGEPSEGSATWEELREHAAFPAPMTTIREAEVTTELGTFACLVYRVQGDGPQAPTRIFYFAKSLPGPPIRVTIEAADGTETTVMEMTARG